MFKKNISIFFIISWNFLLLISKVFATAPGVNCIWLPGCKNTTITTPDSASNLTENVALTWIWNIIWLLIQYVAVIAVISLMIAWLFYIFSGWDEEKAKKAKMWIIWSLAWVVISVSAWWIINIINNFKI